MSGLSVAPGLFRLAPETGGGFPTLAPRAAVTQRRFIALVVRDGGRLLVRRRPPGVVNAGLWEFPNVEVAVKQKISRRWSLRLIVSPRAPFFRVRHSITRYRILLEAYHAELPGRSRSAAAGASWKTAG
jgi:adenine-specific DNA glycosylase